MTKQIERILICLLWMLAATLGCTFWFITYFGFNIFSAQHWQYLAYLQASQTSIRPVFYISLVIAIFITVFGLYILIWPRGDAKTFWHKKNKTVSAPTVNTANQPMPAPAAPSPITAPQAAPDRPRPPKISASFSPMITQPSTQPAVDLQRRAPVSTSDFDEIHNIFKSSGWTVKPSPQIGNFKPALFAIGTDETLWIGGIGIDASPIASAINTLSSVFSDTLTDIEINIYGFIVQPTETIKDSNIMVFENISALKKYMTNHANQPPTDKDEIENFNAYSEYIDTVIKYIGQS